MKNYLRNIFRVLFVSLLLASCSEQETIVSEQKAESNSVIDENSAILAEKSSCLPYGFIVNKNRIKPGSTSSRVRKLYKLRQGVALYRCFTRMYSFYAKNKSITNSDLRTLKLKDLIPFNRKKEITNFVISIYKAGNTTRRWSLFTQYLDYVVSNVYGFQAKNIYDLSNKADEYGKYGSYSIIFSKNYIYSGKGGGIDRCEKSAKSRCKKSPLKADYQRASTKLIIKSSLIRNPNLQRQAYKEEAVRMYLSGFRNANISNDDYYNLRQSPGRKYIMQDGF